MVRIYDDEDCTAPPWESVKSVKLSWGLSNAITGNTQSFDISRNLRDDERLDWRTFPPDSSDAGEDHSERDLPGCQRYLKSTAKDPIGNVLQAKACTPLGMVVNVSLLFSKRAKCTNQCLDVVRECIG